MYFNIFIFVSFSHCKSGQGCKVCPYVNMLEVQKPHESVTREDLKLHVVQQQRPYTSAQQALFEKTLLLYRAYRIHGCLGPIDTTIADAAADEEYQEDDWTRQARKSRRGHHAKLTCNGPLIFDYDYAGKAFVR
jgi:hypothetical protein